MSSLLEVRRIIPQSVAVSRHKTSGPSDQSRGRTWRTLGSTWSSSRVISAEESETRETNMDTTSDQRKCHNCGQGGHLRRDCPEAPSQEGGFGSYNSGAACFGCGKVGHLKRDCPTSAGGRACHNCGQVGHIRRDCPEEAQPPKCHNCVHFSSPERQR
ncbi:hypothetical protein PC129_g2849 [Phytophthora cactorum]|uniref:CCHC-type domain-containing protein n=1 Tax=Phytophthora cactorum TaxID=29920 RepID=A0A8T1C7B9_9STRA|nr:hypothetical protein PC111_g3900 [Phytophthora cactorum]KAG2863436.1 hypothetical protein PC113_g5435 [Phytophthora cactorum]KAG2915845.1 hypothetical protein PC115_g11250 [Phytophthora cactorum]KAG2929862.1 hypothetical protein PC114_g2622 [Phytophthora cactorum]KAG2954302.1 hypothetical protein PC117_g1319 [Phytophthora cactorum]